MANICIDIEMTKFFFPLALVHSRFIIIWYNFINKLYIISIILVRISLLLMGSRAQNVNNVDEK